MLQRRAPSSEPGRLGKLSLKRSGKRLYLKVAVTDAGKVKVGSAVVTLRHPGTASFKLKLSDAQTARLESGRTVTLTEKVSYTPDHGLGITKTTKLKVR